MADKPEVVKIYEGRMTEDYISNQVYGRRHSEDHQAHKDRIADLDMLYAGDLSELFPEDDLPDRPLVENKFKNALHDLARLSAESKEVPVWMLDGDDTKAQRKARVREQIADTIWEMGDGPSIKRKLYMDLIGCGYMALGLFHNKESDYAQFMRLDPRYCYPSVRNGHLVDMLYVETMKVTDAMSEFPEVGLQEGPDLSDECMVIQFYDKDEVAQAICTQTSKGKIAEVYIQSRWVHKLECVPVAFEALETFDGAFRGVLDQVGGPLMIRNKIVAFMMDYIEDMVHAPFEAKNVMNAGQRPGPLTIYEHDPNADQSFMRRVAPAAPAGQVFGLLQYLEGQEAMEAVQPPSRVGSVSQSIASGSFVASTQGSLSSAIKEMQDHMAALRKRFHYIAFKIEKKYLNKQKGLIRAVGQKATYTPKTDIGEKYEHRILFGAGAGLDKQYADTRVIQHQGAGFISKETARGQIDYVDDPMSEQDKIDREQLGAVLFQRWAADPSTAMSQMAQVFVLLGKGVTLLDAMEEVAPQIAAREQEQAAAAAPAGPAGMEPGGAMPEDQAALEAGATPETGGAAFAPLSPFSPPPLQQQIVRS